MIDHLVCRCRWIPPRMLAVLHSGLRWGAVALTAWHLEVQPTRAGDDWTEALRQMPLPSAIQPLNRQTCIPALLDAFQSNVFIKGLIFLPGLADDFYLIHRDHPLNLRAGNLFQALVALTNGAAARLSLKPPWLLVHTDRDVMAPKMVLRHRPTAERLARTLPKHNVRFCDRGWPSLQPLIRQALSVRLLPVANSPQAIHVPRVNFAGWTLTDAELLEGIALATGRTVTILRNGASIEPASANGIAE